LAEFNDVIWINPFGGISGTLFPDKNIMRGRLTVYNPGVNLLPLPSMRFFNNRRRLLQVKMYLLERDFEPDIVIFDDPYARNFAAYFRKKSSLVVYYAGEDKEERPERSEEDLLVESTDLVFVTSPQLFRRLEESGKVHLVESKVEFDGKFSDEEIEIDSLEKVYMEDLKRRLEVIGRILEEALKKR